MKTQLSAARVRELFDYCPRTGALTRRITTSSKAIAGMVISKIDERGYIRVMADGQRYKAHRLAWLYVHGEWPAEDIDHRNGVRHDNRITNLRAVPRSVNNQNIRGPLGNNKSTGLLGVHKRGSKWTAHIWAGEKLRHLGTFPDAEAAQGAYLSAKRKLHLGCTI